MGTVVLPSTSGRPDVKNKKKSSSLTGRKKTPTYGTAHQPTTDDAVHPPPTHRPNFYYIQENSSAAVPPPPAEPPPPPPPWLWLVGFGFPTYRTAHPPTTDDAGYPPPTHRPNLCYIQQNSSAAVRTSEQQCSSTYSTAEQQCSSAYMRSAVQQYVQQYTPGTRGAVSCWFL